ncbi:hypothetical protein M1B74_12235 [Bacteroides pyogenes]|uniref:hypothetical protein n=1 Tax=Bacteroides pyogenes TaxID=310300 RepID=UPI003B43ACA4
MFLLFKQIIVIVISNSRKISIGVALALAGSLLCGGSVWLWLAEICARKFLIRLLFTIALAIAVYILTYALIIGGILWLLIS